MRSISLCNVHYKVITKTLINKLKEIMPRLIAPNQSIIVPGHQVTDNVVINHEAAHSMKSKKSGKGIRTIKIDLERLMTDCHGVSLGTYWKMCDYLAIGPTTSCIALKHLVCQLFGTEETCHGSSQQGVYVREMQSSHTSSFSG